MVPRGSIIQPNQRVKWWARQDSNLGPRDYESPDLKTVNLGSATVCENSDQLDLLKVDAA